MNIEQSNLNINGLFLFNLVLKNRISEYNFIEVHKKGGKQMIVEDNRNSNNNQVGGAIQNVILENREKLSVSGVNDVLSFDDQVVIIETELGLLTIKGYNLKINKLNIDTSEVVVEGEINSLIYSEHHGKSENSLFGKIFK